MEREILPPVDVRDAAGVDPQGVSLGRYRILRRLGAGAMGDVYLAEDPRIGRRLAVKTVRLGDGRPEEIEDRRQRLLREARAAGRLSHNHVVTLFDAGEQDGQLYLALEYVEGRDLADRLIDGPPPTLREILSILRQAAEGLAHAHGQGIVHRDVKPGNILLDREGRVKVGDFGIAKLAGQSTELTTTGAVVGSPLYLSPEQVRGEPLDGRSDVFSLGVVAYEMLTGARPFQGETLTTLVYQILNHEPPPVSALRPEVPPAVERLLVTMLAKDRDERPAAERLAAELRRLGSTLSTVLLDRPVRPATGTSSAAGSSSATVPLAAAGGPRRPPQATAGGTRRWRAVAVALAVAMTLGVLGAAGLVAWRVAFPERPPAPPKRVSAETGSAEVIPIETIPIETVPTATVPAERAPAEPMRAKTVPADPARLETAPPDTAPRNTAPAGGGPAGGSSNRSGSAAVEPTPAEQPVAGAKPAPGKVFAGPPEQEGPLDRSARPFPPAGPRPHGSAWQPGAGGPPGRPQRHPPLGERARQVLREGVEVRQTGLLLRFDVVPPDATVTINRQPRGQAKDFADQPLRLPHPGRYLVVLRKGHFEHRVAVLAKEGIGEVAVIEVQLEAPAP